MAYTTYNCDFLTGGAARALDSHDVADLSNGDRARCDVSGEVTQFNYNSSGTAVENVTTHPYVVRPDDYSSSGNWEEQQVDRAAIGANADITSLTALDDDGIPVAKVAGAIETATLASAVITADRVMKGSGGVRGVVETAIVVDSDGIMVNPNQSCFNVIPAAIQYNLAVAAYTTVIWGTEVFDTGNNFAANTWTAPVDCKLQLSLLFELDALDIAGTLYTIRITTSNKNYYLYYNPAAFAADFDNLGVSFAMLVDMDQNDTVKIEIFQAAGTAQTDIKVNSAFSGVIVC